MKSVDTAPGLERLREPGFQKLSKLCCMRSTPTEMQSMNENDFECLAKTRVNAPGTMFPIAPEFLYFVSLLRFVRVSVSVGNDWSMTKLANLRIPALESNGRRLAVANLAIPWTIVHASSAN